MLIHTQQRRAGLLSFLSDLPCVWERFGKPLGKLVLHFPLRKTPQRYSVPYQQMSNEKRFVNAHCGAAAPHVNGSPEMQTILFSPVRN